MSNTRSGDAEAHDQEIQMQSQLERIGDILKDKKAENYDLVRRNADLLAHQICVTPTKFVRHVDVAINFLEMYQVATPLAREAFAIANKWLLSELEQAKKEEKKAVAAEVKYRTKLLSRLERLGKLWEANDKLALSQAEEKKKQEAPGVAAEGKIKDTSY